MAHDIESSKMADQGTELEKETLKPFKGSKKSRKKGWRKVDIADIEEHLEEVRRDERTGGPASNKADEDLFFVETKLDTGKNNVSRPKKVGIEADEDDDEEYVPRKKKLMNKLDKEAEELEVKRAELKAAQVKTIWGQKVMTVTDAYLESTVKKEKVKPNTVNVGKADLPPVIVDEAGASYNPDYDSHQELLLKAHEEELKILTEIEKWNKKVKMVSVSELKNQSKLWLKEMSEGLSPTGDDDEQQTTDDVDNPNAPAPVSAGNRKTGQQKRRKLLEKKAEQLKKEQKQRKVKLNDILRIKSLKKEIRKTGEKTSTLVTEREEKKISKELKPKRLSRFKFKEGPTHVKLSEELTNSLRTLKPEGNLLNDRFRSFQRRNIIETRNRVLPHRKFKRKAYITRSYKTETIKDFKPKRR